MGRKPTCLKGRAHVFRLAHQILGASPSVMGLPARGIDHLCFFSLEAKTQFSGFCLQPGKIGDKVGRRTPALPAGILPCHQIKPKNREVAQFDSRLTGRRHAQQRIPPRFTDICGLAKADRRRPCLCHACPCAGYFRANRMHVPIVQIFAPTQFPENEMDIVYSRSLESGRMMAAELLRPEPPMCSGGRKRDTIAPASSP